MDLTGEQRIAAPRNIVWSALNDPVVLQHCIPGCESVEKVSDTELNAKIVLKIGPMKAGFGGKITLSEVDPPHGCRITGEGSGGVAGFAKGSALVRLTPEGETTILRYEVGGDIGGKIAQLGSRLMESTARKLAADFFAALDRELRPAPSPAEPLADQPKARWYTKLFGKTPPQDA
jgi:carbon monoxide dehydrogenase subunit G